MSKAISGNGNENARRDTNKTKCRPQCNVGIGAGACRQRVDHFAEQYRLCEVSDCNGGARNCQVDGKHALAAQHR